MVKLIEDYTADELSAKIKAIKAERERTANALKRYEEELERREAGFPLGVPVEDNTFVHCSATYTFNFNSTESQLAFSERLEGYVKTLQGTAKGKPIDIEILKPLLKKGWVAMNKDGSWGWFSEKPRQDETSWIPPLSVGCWRTMDEYDIKSTDDWEKSLQECGL